MISLISTTRLWRRPAAFILLGGLSLAMTAGLGGWFNVQPVVGLDRLMLDALLVRTASGAPASGTVAVDIDEVSLAALGQWPWPRYRVAQLIERIAAEHPSAIAMDMVFSEADRSSLADIRRTFKRDFGIDVSFNGVPAGLLDNDGYLGQVMGHADVVGARYFYFDHTSRSDYALRPGVGFDGRLDLLSPDRATGVMPGVDAIASQTRISGFVNSLSMPTACCDSCLC